MVDDLGFAQHAEISQRSNVEFQQVFPTTWLSLKWIFKPAIGGFKIGGVHNSLSSEFILAPIVNF
jgi:hypothetical protein